MTSSLFKNVFVIGSVSLRLAVEKTKFCRHGTARYLITSVSLRFYHLYFDDSHFLVFVIEKNERTFHMKIALEK